MPAASSNAAYSSWTNIKSRCRNKANPSYRHYGGRGIRVCDRWHDSFDAFLADVGPRPNMAHTIDRIDNNGHYEPGNCRWATRKQQAGNKRSNVLLTFQGETRIIAEWSLLTGIQLCTLYARKKYGWPDEQILSVPAILCTSQWFRWRERLTLRPGQYADVERHIPKI